MELLQALDRGTLLALATARDPLAGSIGLLLAAFTTGGLGWWALTLLGVRAVGPGLRAWRLLFTAVLGGAGSWVVGELLKLVVHRPRPFDVLSIEPLVRPTSYSFPSGDATISFGVATALALTWPASRIPALLLATAVALSRIVVGAHYPSDVLGGTALGIAGGLLAAGLWPRVMRARWRVIVVEPPAGPLWLAPPDLRLASGEAIVRNLQGARRALASRGERAADVAWLVDASACPAQLPQVLRGFGHAACAVASGSPPGGAPGAGARWAAPSGDEVRAVAVYPALERHPTTLARALTDAAASARTATLLVASAPAAACADALRGAGLAAEPGDLAAEAGRLGAAREALVGEPLAPGPAGRAAGSAHAALTAARAACERTLVERCEPLLALAVPSRAREADALWPALLEAQTRRAPDGRAADVAASLASVAARGDALAGELMRALAGPADGAVAWSFVPRRRLAVVDAGGAPRFVELRPFGATRLDGGGPLGGVRSPEAGVLENDRLRVEVAADGSFVVVVLASGRRSGRLNLLVDEGEAGDLDTHRFAGPVVEARERQGARATAVVGDRGTVTVDLVLPLPARLRADGLARTAEVVGCPVRVAVTLDAFAAQVVVDVRIDDRAEDHRLRAVADTGVRALTHRADGAFGTFTRPNRAAGGRAPGEPIGPELVTAGVVSVAGPAGGLALGLAGPREYAVSADGSVLALTLLRTAGARSGGSAQGAGGGTGPLGQRYVVVTFGAEDERLAAERSARDALSPVLVGRGARSVELVRLEGEGLELSALRAAADGRSLVVRLVDHSGVGAVGRLSFGERAVVGARAVDLREGDPALLAAGPDVLRTAAPPEVTRGALGVVLGAHEIATYLVTLDG